MKGFNQVVRVSTNASEELLLDPLSLFAVQKQQTPAVGESPQSQPSEFAPPAAASISTTSSTTAAAAAAAAAAATPTQQPLSGDYLKRISAETPTRRPTANAVSSRLSASTAIATAHPQQGEQGGGSGGGRETLLPAAQPLTLAALAVDNLPLLSGEYTIISLLEASVQLLSYGDIACALFMTNYRLLFLPMDQRAQRLYSSISSLPSWLQVPLSTIDKIEREKRSKDGLIGSMSIVVQCKDCRQLRVTIKAKSSSNVEYDIERALSVLSTYAFPNNIRHLFAFSHKLALPSDLFESLAGEASPKDLMVEFSRLGVLDSSYWRVSGANEQFAVCDTYPPILVTPASITDEDLALIAAFRSGQRLPAMCWAHAESGATLWRSSQPKVGKAGSCWADERLLDAIAKASTIYRKSRYPVPNHKFNSEPILNIVDCRSRTSAMANYAAGAGYESQSSYPSSRLEFYSIPNIHAVRESLRGLTSILLNTNTSASSDISFSKQVEDTSWLSNLRLIIRAGWDTASALTRGTSVLVHCSHGWDRTAQVCGIAEILLDPFYRTFEGFPVLIEKEWCSFGHPFQMRCGHGQERNNQRQDNEISPIFLQFLDCLQQIHKQCSHAFEFNSRYILTIAEHIYTTRFGNFLFNCDKDRVFYKSSDQCSDLWTYLNANRSQFRNHLYLPSVSLNCTGSSQTLPVLSQLLRGVSLWSEYFLRYSSALSLPPLPGQLAHHLISPINPEEGLAACMLDFASLTDVNFALSRRVLTQSDCWEATLKLEMRKREELEVRYSLAKERLEQLVVELGEGEQQHLLLSVLQSMQTGGSDIPSQQVSAHSRNSRAEPRMPALSSPTDEDGQGTGLPKARTYDSIASEAIDDENFTTATDEVDFDVVVSTPKFLNTSCPSPLEGEYDGSGVEFLV